MTSWNMKHSLSIFWSNEWNSSVGMISSWRLILVESRIVETPTHGLAIYSLQMLYGSTSIQSIRFCKKTQSLQKEIYPSRC
jgi:hypothetical protein